MRGDEFGVVELGQRIQVAELVLRRGGLGESGEHLLVVGAVARGGDHARGRREQFGIDVLAAPRGGEDLATTGPGRGVVPERPHRAREQPAEFAGQIRFAR